MSKGGGIFGGDSGLFEKLLIVNALMPSGGGQKAPSPKGDNDGLGCMVGLGIAVIYFVFQFLYWLRDLLIEWFPKDLYVFLGCIPVAIFVWLMMRESDRRVAKRNLDRYNEFMREFNKWEYEQRRIGDCTMYCPGCRGKQTLWGMRRSGCGTGLANNPMMNSSYTCPTCNGSGLRDEQPSQKFVDLFTQWEIGKRASGDDSKYCMFCRGRKIVWVEHGFVKDDYLKQRREELKRPGVLGSKSEWLNYETGETTIPHKCLHCNGSGLRK